MKQLVVAAVLLLTAGSVMAGNFRAGDQLYVPLAGHVVGGGRLFITDLIIQNVENEAVDITYIFIPAATSTPQYVPATGVAYTLGAGQRRQIVDVIAAALSQGGLGLTGAQLGGLIINACRAGGNCTDPNPDTGDDPDFRDIVGFTRTYSVDSLAPNPQAASTFGQAFPGFPWYSFASMTNATSAPVGDLSLLLVAGMRMTHPGGGGAPLGSYRTNLGLMNASQFSETVIELKLYRGSLATQVGNTVNRTLQPLQSYQQRIDIEFGITPGTDMENLFMVAKQIASTARTDAPGFPAGCLASNGCPGFFAFASVLDNTTGDATTLEGVFQVPLTIEALTAIYGAKAGGGANIRRSVRRTP